jgi:hypothetical protein
MNETKVMHLGQSGEFLWGRERGRELRAQMEEHIHHLPRGATLVADLTAVAAMNYSVALELFVKLLSAWERIYPQRGFLLRSPSPEVAEEVSLALEHHGLLVLTEPSPGQWDLLGKVSPADRETLAWAQLQEYFTAPDLAQALGINLTTANQRLKKLESNAVCIRNAVGPRLYRYCLAGR